MLRRPLLFVLSTALVLSPAAVAVAEESTDATGPTAQETAPSTGLDALADLVDAVAAVLGISDVGAPATVELDDEQRTAFRTLLDQVLEGLKVEALVATAEASLLAEDDQDDGIDTDDEALEDETTEDATHGRIVSTVARCAPRGHGMRGLFDSVRNHGELVRTAAHGGVVTLTLPVLTGTGTDVALGEGTTEVTHELTSVAAAEALCADLSVIATAAALSDSLADDGEPDTDRGAAKDERRTERDAAKAERRAERDAAKAERRAARDAAADDRGARRSG